jgi:hypothetical protein
VSPREVRFKINEIGKNSKDAWRWADDHECSRAGKWESAKEVEVGCVSC